MTVTLDSTEGAEGAVWSTQCHGKESPAGTHLPLWSSGCTGALHPAFLRHLASVFRHRSCAASEASLGLVTHFIITMTL